MLNQAEIGDNKNKFYVIQVLQRKDGNYQTWTRWGRVVRVSVIPLQCIADRVRKIRNWILKGESGQNCMSALQSDVNAAIKEFEKKFKDKTKNNWTDRSDFKPVAGKYTLLEMDGSADAQEIIVDHVS
jgi:poly [ADP-ribose] polymerase